MQKNTITPIAELGTRAPEAGRIRLGTSKLNDRGKKQAVKLDTFRFTSTMRELIEQCAVQFGGHVQPWERQWECISETDTIPVVLLPGGIGQDYELWSGGGCLRRCDGITVNVPTPVNDYDYEMVPQPCICGVKGVRECSIKTRVQMIIPSLSFAGVWRLDTSGFNAAEELPGMHDMIIRLGEANMVQAILSMEYREKVVPTNRGVQTRRFVVPKFSVAQTVHQLAAGQAGLATLGPGAPAQQAALPRGDVSAPSVTLESSEGNLIGADDDIAEGELITDEQIQLERELADCARYYGMDEERFVRAVARSVNSDPVRMQDCATKMRAGELSPVSFKPDGSIQWAR